MWCQARGKFIPLLFAIFLNDLECVLLHKGLSGITIDLNDNDIMVYKKLFTLLYADDNVLMAESPTDMQQCLNAFVSYCQEWKLTINKDKTKLLIFGARKGSNIAFKIDGEIIETVAKYKYLGIFFTQSGSFLNARSISYNKQRKR